MHLTRKCHKIHHVLNHQHMKHQTILLSTLLLMPSSLVMAQDYDDDMYFSPKKTKKEATVRKVEIVYEEETPEAYTPVPPMSYSQTDYPERDVDEYNRRGRSIQSYADTVVTEEGADTRQTTAYVLADQSLYDLGYSDGYKQGFEDGEDLDYYYGVRLARFHGRHFYDSWYWGSLSYVYDPWHWDSWYWDSWYRPYYYGGWCSVGWGIGYWGSYWHSPWHGWHVPPPHHHNGHWGYYPAPRHSTVRNRDYGRSRIMDRSTRYGEYGRNNSRGDVGHNGNGTINRNNNGRSDRSMRLNQRSTDRYNRAVERANNRNTNRVTSGTNRDTQNTSPNRGNSRPNRGTQGTSTNRNNSRNDGYRMDRSSNRSSGSNFRSGSSSSSSSRGGFGGGGVRSGSSRGGGRGR